MYAIKFRIKSDIIFTEICLFMKTKRIFQNKISNHLPKNRQQIELKTVIITFRISTYEPVSVD